MTTESPQPQTTPDADMPMLDSAQSTDPPQESTDQVQKGRKRPRIEMAADPASQQRKRGKSMFGLLVGTLTKAKNEDKERNSSEAAKKRQLIEQRLQEKLRKETDSVRRAEEAKKDKTTANRKEEDLQLRDSIYKLRRTRLPILANFLLTSDDIPDNLAPSESSLSPPAANASPEDTAAALAGPPRTHPPPLYYLPAILTPAQEAFLQKRKEKVKVAAEAEWSAFVSERAKGIAEIARLRERVKEEDARIRESKAEKEQGQGQDQDQEREGGADKTAQRNGSGDEVVEDVQMDKSEERPGVATQNGKSESKAEEEEAKMDVDDSSPSGDPTKEGEKEERAPATVPVQADDDDAVEY